MRTKGKVWRTDEDGAENEETELTLARQIPELGRIRNDLLMLQKVKG